MNHLYILWETKSPQMRINRRMGCFKTPEFKVTHNAETLIQTVPVSYKNVHYDFLLEWFLNLLLSLFLFLCRFWEITKRCECFHSGLDLIWMHLHNLKRQKTGGGGVHLNGCTVWAFSLSYENLFLFPVNVFWLKCLVSTNNGSYTVWTRFSFSIQTVSYSSIYCLLLCLYLTAFAH